MEECKNCNRACLHIQCGFGLKWTEVTNGLKVSEAGFLSKRLNNVLTFDTIMNHQKHNWLTGNCSNVFDHTTEKDHGR